VSQRARRGYGVCRSVPEQRPLLACAVPLCAGQVAGLGPDAPRPAAPNPYEDPRCQETDSPSERLLPNFPLCFRLSASVSGNVCRLHCRRLVHQRGGTTHVLRLSRLRDGEDSQTCMGSAAA
jgi:hypothetical protein